MKDKQSSVIVIANCHCLPLADALALGGRNIKTDFIDVTFADRPHMSLKIDNLLSSASHDFVLSFNLSTQFNRLETGILRENLGDRLRTFTNIHFDGLHPDVTYIGTIGQRTPGFFDDYHSKLVLFCFVTGRGTDDCLRLFNGGVYKKLGYFDIYANSTRELLQRDNVCDIKFAAHFLDMIRFEPCLYTVNHPTGPVFLELSALLADAVGFDFIKMNQVFFQNHLSTNFIWPVYDEIAEHHGLAYRTPAFFIKPGERVSRSASLQEFVEGSYVAYSQANFDEFAAMVKSLPFFKAFSESL